MVDKKTIKVGEEIIIERNLKAEVPYELVKIIEENGNGRMFTRNIRNDAGVAENKLNIAKQKQKEADDAMKTAEVAKKAVSGKNTKKEE